MNTKLENYFVFVVRTICVSHTSTRIGTWLTKYEADIACSAVCRCVKLVSTISPLREQKLDKVMAED